ncbi:MAG TPA: HD-GYP domain-containing protein [Burkholderiales bacterium]|nr:HD-GYP domain-containing protein [Burkholderiales bacterium]
MSELRFGMYIAELDRPWTDTPFRFQGFVLSTEQQLEALQKHCKTVFVDLERSESPDAPRAAPLPLGRTLYPEKATVEQELGPARVAYTGSQLLMNAALSAVRIGRTLDAERVRAAIDSLTASVLRNPDAMLLFSQLREKGEYAVSHALDVSIYMTAFGRFLQLEPGQIEFLGYVGLLQDIGKVRLPKPLLEKRGRLNAEEFEQAKLHVNYSVEILRATPGIPRDLPRIAVLHHERQDGSGYPNHLRGSQIGMIGSIAGIIDTFDAMTVRRPHADPVAPSAAISNLYKWRGAFFDTQLVEQFIRFIGIFPVGSLVELNSGEIAVVMSQNPAKRLQPRVMVIRDSKGNPLRPQKLLDLSRSPKATPEEPYRILRTLEHGHVPVTSDELFMQ